MAGNEMRAVVKCVNDMLQVIADRLALSAFRGILALLEGLVPPDLRARLAGLELLELLEHLEDREFAADKASPVVLDLKVSR